MGLYHVPLSIKVEVSEKKGSGFKIKNRVINTNSYFMAKWIIIIAFNILFGLLMGFIVTRVFNNRGYSTNPNDNELQWKVERKRILAITIATVICGPLFWGALKEKPFLWLGYGLLFSHTVTILSIFFVYTHNQWEELELRPKPGVIITSKMEFISELYKSFSAPGAFFLVLASIFYGYISLLIPLTGLAWGYLQRYLLKLE